MACKSQVLLQASQKRKREELQKIKILQRFLLHESSPRGSWWLNFVVLEVKTEVDVFWWQVIEYSIKCLRKIRLKICPSKTSPHSSLQAKTFVTWTSLSNHSPASFWGTGKQRSATEFSTSQRFRDAAKPPRGNTSTYWLHALATSGAKLSLC